MRDIQRFTEEEMELIHLAVTGECRHYSPVEDCRPLMRPCHMTGVNARDSPVCRHFVEIIFHHAATHCRRYMGQGKETTNIMRIGSELCDLSE